MLRGAAVACLWACSNGAPSSGEARDRTATSSANDAVTAPGDAALDSTAPPSVDAGIAPAPPGSRAPGVYPVLVVHRLDSKAHAYILACANIEKDKPATLMGPAACAKIIGTPSVELIANNGTRSAVTLGAAGKGSPCPGDMPAQPWVAIKGLPAKRDQMLVLPVGVTLEDRPIDRQTLARIERKHVRVPRPGGKAQGIQVRGQIDLDGDGVHEVITDHLGSVRLFSSSGQVIGEVGCQFL